MPILTSKFFALAVALMLLCGCATREHVADQYDSVLRQYPASSDQTVIVILVDGLSQSMLAAARSKMPYVSSYFDSNFAAHSTFPSLTFPAIASLLKEKPPSETGFIGNSFFVGKKLVQFENVLKRKTVSKLMAGNNIFTRLAAQGKRSVSLDYGLGIDATSVAPLEDFESALTIGEGDFSYADQKKIDSLYELLSKYDLRQWPSFVFIHLVGVDFLAHENGPFDDSTISYIASLDEKLQPLLELLRQQETKHAVVTVLTADHGFAEKIKYSINLEGILAKVSNEIEVLNEGRMAAVYIHGVSQTQTANELLNHKGVQAVAVKIKDSFNVRSNLKMNETDYPFFLQDLSNYFGAPNSPDLVVIPDDETVFSKTYVGYHGGPTAAETLVPLLTRNAKLTSGEPPALWHLLKKIVK